MIDLCGPALRVAVDPAEYNRLLGYPRDFALEGRAQELADRTRQWYAAHGRPWIYARPAALETAGDSIRIEGREFTSERLGRMLQDVEAHGAIIAALSAGPELEEESLTLWRDEKPDEYFFLETYGSAVVERLVSVAGARLWDWAQARGCAVIPHYSPGYPGWDISEQSRLFELLQPGVGHRLEVLESGALRPKKSLVAVFGLTRRTAGLRPITDVVPCQTCSLGSCDYRRTPRLANESAYQTNRKALKRWTAERLSIETKEDRSVHAHFRFDGTTCTNMGRPLAFNYDVKLGPREEGFPIREQRCSPSPGDEGHKYMCRYLKEGEWLLAAIEHENPLLGQPLEDVLAWERSSYSTGCYCDAESREHKWGLVLETIHYALH